MDNKNGHLGMESIGRLMRGYAIPCVISLLVGVVALLLVEVFPRQLIAIFGVGFALLLPKFFGLDGVLYSMPVSDVLTFLIAAVMIVKTYRELGDTKALS